MLRWKVCVVVSSGTQGLLKRCFESLRSAGFTDGIHVICTTDVTVPNSQDISRQRVPTSLTQASQWHSAIDTVAKSYCASNDIFLFLSPRVRVWRHMRKFVEATLEPDFIGLYFPYAPERFFIETSWGGNGCTSKRASWCELAMDRPSNAAEAVIMHRHSARVVSDYLRDYDDLLKNGSWPDALARVIERYKLNSYVATPSFARYEPDVDVDYVESYPQGKLDRRHNYYLEKD